MQWAWWRQGVTLFLAGSGLTGAELALVQEGWWAAARAGGMPHD